MPTLLGFVVSVIVPACFFYNWTCFFIWNILKFTVYVLGMDTGFLICIYNSKWDFIVYPSINVQASRSRTLYSVTFPAKSAVSSTLLFNKYL